MVVATGRANRVRGRRARIRARGVEQHGQVAAHLGVPAPREKADQGLVRGREPRARRVAVERGQHVEHGVPDELDGHPRLLVEAHLEREDRQDPAHVARHGAEPAPAPRPHLGGDEVHHGHPEPPRGPGQAHVELREVDEDEHPGTPLPEVAAKRLEGLPERGKAAQGFRPPHDGHALGALHEAHPRGGHRGPAHAGEPDAGRQRRERPRQRGPVEVSRRLAGHDENVSPSRDSPRPRQC